MTDLATHLRKARRARWAKASQEEKSAAASNAAKAYWSKMKPEEKSAEQKRRAAKRKRWRMS